MTDRCRGDLFAVVSRGSSTRTQCESRLRQAQESARHAREMLRRAIREVDEAEGALGEALRRQDQQGRSPTPRTPGHGVMPGGW